MHSYTHPFEPIVDENSKFLILGSFPSFDSFEYNFYYANRYNVFWKIMEEIFKVKLNNIQEKKELMLKNQIALWDVVKSCQRDSSLDSRLKNIELNDIYAFLKKYPYIRKIGCNGRKSYDLLCKNFKNIDLPIVYLTSTSPANARVKYQKKLQIYKDFLQTQ